jgi:hypothetical protein
MRKANRTSTAWAILAPLILINLLLGAAERLLNAYFVFHYHQYVCSALGDLLRVFALSIAAWLALADLLQLRSRLLRFLLAFLFLLLAGVWQLAPNQWPMLNSSFWIIAYFIMLMAFMLGHAGLKALLSRFSGPKGFPNGYAGLCLLFGLGPILIIGGLGLKLDRPTELSSTFELIRTWIVLGAAFTLPYFVLFWFILSARFFPSLAPRLANGFGAVTKQS